MCTWPEYISTDAKTPIGALRIPRGLRGKTFPTGEPRVPRVYPGLPDLGVI
jgi:hypothetical protein